MCKLKKHVWLIISIMFQFSSTISAQDDNFSGLSVISDLAEELASSEIATSDIVEISEDLVYLLDHPLELNMANEEDLKQLHILNDFQIFTLLEYIRDYGPILSLVELQTIIGFSIDVIKKMEPFVRLSQRPQPANKKPHKIQQSFIFNYSTDFDNNKPEYPGKNRSITSRYQIKSGSSWFVGLLFDQDTGETFKLPGQPFKPDFMSAYLEMNRKGFLNHIIIGDFRASYGQGLVLSNFSQRKGTPVLRKPERTGLKKYSSTEENDFFRGIALKFKYGKLAMDLFYSRHFRDATVYFDSCFYIKSLSSNGLHRTTTELRNKDAVLIKSYGSHVSLKTKIIDMGLTCFSQNLNTDYLIKTDPFTSFRIRDGNAIINMSTDYKVNLNKIILFGEFASDFKGRMAILNGFLAELHPLIHCSSLYRRYHPSYFGLKAGGFAEKSNIRNEEGYYFSIEMYPWKYFKIDIFTDVYKFPHVDNSNVSPVTGSDYFIKYSFFTEDKSEFSYRIRYEKKQVKCDRQGPGIDLTDTNFKISNRFEFKFNVQPGLFLKSRTEFNYFRKPESGWSKAYYCANDLGYEHDNNKCRLWIRYAFFDIPGWDNRIYAFENDVLHSFSTPVFNSAGIRIICLAKICLHGNLEFWLRYSCSSFYRSKITGTGTEKKVEKNFPYFTFQMRIKR